MTDAKDDPKNPKDPLYLRSASAQGQDQGLSSKEEKPTKRTDDPEEATYEESLMPIQPDDTVWNAYQIPANIAAKFAGKKSKSTEPDSPSQHQDQTQDMAQDQTQVMAQDQTQDMAQDQTEVISESQQAKACLAIPTPSPVTNSSDLFLPAEMRAYLAIPTPSRDPKIVNIRPRVDINIEDIDNYETIRRLYMKKRLH